jgi:hypothetical protein
MAWTIGSNPEDVHFGGYDGYAWRWCLESDHGLRSESIVKISRTAMGVSLETLPEATRRARETSGRSAVEIFLEWFEPPHVLEFHSKSTSPMVGGGSEQPPSESDPRTESRLQEIEAFMRDRRITLRLDRVGEEWVALLIPDALRLGATDAGVGRSRLEAAEDAKRIVEGYGDDQNLGDRSRVIEVSAADQITLLDTDDVVRSILPKELNADLRERIEKVVDSFGWKFRWTAEPDGSFYWFVIDDATDEVLKSGKADSWDDAKLDAFLELMPPWGEE